MANPNLKEDVRSELVMRLMKVWRAVRDGKRDADIDAEAAAHTVVDEIKRALGERGPIWWDDGARDLNRNLAKNASYADWYAKIV